MAMLRPSMNPAPFRPCRNPGMTRPRSFCDRLLRNPIAGIIGCCARAARGHATAPPISDINSRRFTVRSLPCFRPKGYHTSVRQTAASILQPLRGLEIDRQLELDRGLDGKFARL